MNKMFLKSLQSEENCHLWLSKFMTVVSSEDVISNKRWQAIHLSVCGPCQQSKSKLSDGHNYYIIVSINK